MNNAHPEITEVSALDRSHLSTVGTIYCRCRRGNSLTVIVRQLWRIGLDIEEGFQIGDQHHAD